MYEILQLGEVFNKINTDEPLAFDTETIGKYGKIRLAQFYQKHWDKAVLVHWPDPDQLLLHFVAMPQVKIVMQYASYDVSTIQDLTGSRWCPANYEDTFLLARVAFPHLDEYSLDALAAYVLGFDPYAKAGIDKSAMHKANWAATALPDKQLEYSAIDVYYLLDLYDAVKSAEESTSYKLDKIFLTKAFDFQRNGLPVDEERRTRIYEANLAEIQSYGMPINVNSYKQVRPYIGSNSSDDLGLARLALQGNEKAASVRAVRKLIKQNSFLDKFATDDGYIYGKFVPSARSGRTTCNDQNLQQLPRILKEVFGYPTNSDRILLYSDYSQLELRGIASITGEPEMLRAYRNNEDLHDLVATILFGADFTKEQRQIAKTCNFNLLYGGGAIVFQNILLAQAGILLEIEVIRRIIRKWKNLFRVIAQWQEAGIRAFHRGSLGSTPFGRKYKARLMTDQLNLENQGFGAEVSKLALHYMYDDVKKYEGRFSNFVHDSYIIDMPADPELYKPCAKRVGEAMQEAWFESTKMVKIKDLPMPVKVLAGYNWGDIEKGDYVHAYAA